MCSFRAGGKEILVCSFRAGGIFWVNLRAGMAICGWRKGLAAKGGGQRGLCPKPRMFFLSNASLKNLNKKKGNMW